MSVTSMKFLNISTSNAYKKMFHYTYTISYTLRDTPFLGDVSDQKSRDIFDFLSERSSVSDWQPGHHCRGIRITERVQQICLPIYFQY